MKTLNFNFDSSDAINSGEASSESRHGSSSKKAAAIKPLQDAAFAAAKSLAKSLGSDCRSNIAITLEDDGTSSIMVNVAQLSK